MRRRIRQAQLVFREKIALENGLIREAVIWQVIRNEKYPDGIRYRLALVEPYTRRVLVLFDNHYPKGHHRHLVSGTEEVYRFENVEKLVQDYLKATESEERQYASKKN